MLSVASLCFGFGGVAIGQRSAVMRASPVMQVDAPAKAELKMNLAEPVFPEVCEYAGITLSR